MVCLPSCVSPYLCCFCVRSYPQHSLDVVAVTAVTSPAGVTTSPTTAIVGAGKTLQFNGVGLAAGDVATWVSWPADSLPATCMNGIVHSRATLSGDLTASFTFPAPVEASLCYAHRGQPAHLYADVVPDIRVRALQHLAGSTGATTRVVAGVFKTLVLSGFGAEGGDVVRWVRMPSGEEVTGGTPDQLCSAARAIPFHARTTTVTPTPTAVLPSDGTVLSHPLASAPASFGAAADDFGCIIGSPTADRPECLVVDVAFPSSTLQAVSQGEVVACASLQGEPYQLFPDLTLTIVHFGGLVNASSADASSVIVETPKAAKVDGVGIASGDMMRLVSTSPGHTSGACDAFPAQGGAGDIMVTDGSSVILAFSAVTPASSFDELGRPAWRLCYRFAGEPSFWVYPATLRVRGKPLPRTFPLAVQAVPRPVLITVAGGAVAGDQAMFVPAGTACSPGSHPAATPATAVDAAGGATVVFPLPVQFPGLTLCYSFYREGWMAMPDVIMHEVVAPSETLTTTRVMDAITGPGVSAADVPAMLRTLLDQGSLQPSGLGSVVHTLLTDAVTTGGGVVVPAGELDAYVYNVTRSAVVGSKATAAASLRAAVEVGATAASPGPLAAAAVRGTVDALLEGYSAANATVATPGSVLIGLSASLQAEATSESRELDALLLAAVQAALATDIAVGTGGATTSGGDATVALGADAVLVSQSGGSNTSRRLVSKREATLSTFPCYAVSADIRQGSCYSVLVDGVHGQFSTDDSSPSVLTMTSPSCRAGFTPQCRKKSTELSVDWEVVPCTVGTDAAGGDTLVYSTLSFSVVAPVCAVVDDDGAAGISFTST